IRSSRVPTKTTPPEIAATSAQPPTSKREGAVAMAAPSFRYRFSSATRGESVVWASPGPAARSTAAAKGASRNRRASVTSSSHWTPGRLYSHRHFILDRNRQERRRGNLEIGKRRRYRSGNPRVDSLCHLLEWNLPILDRLTRELDLEIAVDRGCSEGRFGQSDTHAHDRKLSAVCGLNHVKIAVAVPRIKRLHGRRDQDIALSGVANHFSSSCMADALGLMQRMRYMIRKRGLFEHPLTGRLGKSGKRQKQTDHQHSRPHSATHQLTICPPDESVFIHKPQLRI